MSGGSSISRRSTVVAAAVVVVVVVIVVVVVVVVVVASSFLLLFLFPALLPLALPRPPPAPVALRRAGQARQAGRDLAAGVAVRLVYCAGDRVSFLLPLSSGAGFGVAVVSRRCRRPPRLPRPRLHRPPPRALRRRSAAAARGWLHGQRPLGPGNRQKGHEDREPPAGARGGEPGRGRGLPRGPARRRRRGALAAQPCLRRGWSRRPAARGAVPAGEEGHGLASGEK